MTPRETAEQCIPEAIELYKLGIKIKFHYGMWRHIPEDNTTWILTEYDLIDFLNRSKDNKYCQKTYIPIPDAEWAWNWLKKKHYNIEINSKWFMVCVCNNNKFRHLVIKDSLTKALLKAVIEIHKKEISHE